MKKHQILRKNWEFQQIIKKRKQIVNSNLIAYYENNDEMLRIGISISKKFLKSHQRNYLRRQIRMILDEVINFEDYKLNVVLIVRKPFIQKKYINKKEIIQKFFKKIEKNVKK